MPGAIAVTAKPTVYTSAMLIDLALTFASVSAFARSPGLIVSVERTIISNNERVKVIQEEHDTVIEYCDQQAKHMADQCCCGDHPERVVIRGSR